MSVECNNRPIEIPRLPILAQVWNSRWPLLAFALWFQLLESLLFTPVMGLIGGMLAGRPVMDSTALVSFFLSPRGFIVLFLGLTVSLTIRMVEHAGLSALVMGTLEEKRFRAWVVSLVTDGVTSTGGHWRPHRGMGRGGFFTGAGRGGGSCPTPAEAT